MLIISAKKAPEKSGALVNMNKSKIWFVVRRFPTILLPKMAG